MKVMVNDKGSFLFNFININDSHTRVNMSTTKTKKKPHIIYEVIRFCFIFSN